jgi:tetratricopeptide (TPR) repeat protein
MLLPRYLSWAQFLLTAVAFAAGPSSQNTCEKEWDQLQADPRFASTASKIKQFESYASFCAGSGLYEVQLGQLYMDAKDFDKARRIVEDALKQNTPHRRELLFKDATTFLANQDLARAQDIFQTVIREYPNSYEGYSGLGVVFLIQHRAKESIEQYEKANSILPSMLAYRNLVIVYTQEGRYRDATNAFDNYYRFDSDAIGDRDAAFTAALAYANQGKLEFADGTLRGLLHAKPELKDDKAIIELSRKVNEAMHAKKN